jgi:hypothetical protein
MHFHIYIFLREHEVGLEAGTNLPVNGCPREDKLLRFS